MIHVVMDTNVLINALFHNDKYAQKLLSCIAGNRIKLVVSEAIAVEYLDIVMLHAVSAGLTLDQAKKPLRKLIKTLLSGKLVAPKIRLKIVSDDPEDDKFFECAYEADVTVIVTQDGDISAVEQASTCTGKQIKIYSPWRFLQDYIL
jgi:putative PIN family toxin of toxin-antitoxin system